MSNADVVNVKDYGAVGNGTIPDDAAINAALAAASTTGLRHVFFPAGTYLVKSPLQPPHVPVRLFGADRNASLLRAGANVDIIDIQWSNDLYIEHLGFLDDLSRQTSKGAIHINNAVGGQQRIYIRDCQFDRVWTAIYNDNTQANPTAGVHICTCLMFTRGSAIEMFYSQDTYISDVESDHVNILQDPSVLRDMWFYGHLPAGGGIILQRVTVNGPAQFGIIIEECLQVWANHIGSDGAGLRSTLNNPCGILIQDSDQINVSNAWSHNCPYDNMRILGCTRVTVTECQFAGFAPPGGIGLKIGKNGTRVSERIMVANCRVYDYRTEAIHVYDSGYVQVQIIGCSCVEFDANSTGGIVLENCNNAVLSGNAVLGPPSGDQGGLTNYGIHLFNTQQSTVTGNTVRGFKKGVVEGGTSNYNSIISNVCGFNGGGPADAIVKIGAQTVPSTLNYNIG